MHTALHSRSVLWATYIALVGALVALVAALGAGGAPAVGAAPTQTGSVVLSGTTITWTATPPAVGGGTQVVGNGSGCELKQGNGSLLQFSGGSKSVGLVSGSIGVKSKGNGQDCGQFEAGEVLTVSMGPSLQGQAIYSARLDLEVLQNARVTMTALYVEGSKTISAGSFALLTGTLVPSGVAAGNTPMSTSAAPNAYCRPSSSSGPNAAARDNCTWTIESTVPFNRFTLEAAGGTASLEGGGDWSGSSEDRTSGDSDDHTTTYSADRTTRLSLTTAPDGILNCGDRVNAVPRSGDPSVIGVVERLTNTNGSPCNLKPYRFSVVDVGGQTQVEFVPQGADAARFTAGISKAVSSINPTTEGDKLLYDPDGPGPLGFQTVPACSTSTISTSIVSGNVLRRVTAATLPAGESWCVAAVDAIQTGPGTFVATFWLYGQDDPYFR